MFPPGLSGTQAADRRLTRGDEEAAREALAGSEHGVMGRPPGAGVSAGRGGPPISIRGPRMLAEPASTSRSSSFSRSTSRDSFAVRSACRDRTICLPCRVRQSRTARPSRGSGRRDTSPTCSSFATRLVSAGCLSCSVAPFLTPAPDPTSCRRAQRAVSAESPGPRRVSRDHGDGCRTGPAATWVSGS